MGSLPHFPGGFVGERDGGYIAGTDTASADEVYNLVGDDLGLSAAGSSQHEQGCAEMFHGLPLHRIELGF